MRKTVTLLLAFLFIAAASVAARAQAAREATIQPETKVKLVLQTRLSSKLSEVGDPVVAVLDQPVYVDDQLVLPRGTEFHGRVTQVSPARRGQKAASMSLAFERVSMPWGDEPVFLTVTGADDWDKNEKVKANDEGKITGGHRGDKTVDNVYRGGAIGGAGAGVILLSGGGGAAGAGALGGGLLAGLLLTKGGELQMNPGVIFRMKFAKPLTLPVSSQSGRTPRPIQQEDAKPPVKNNN